METFSRLFTRRTRATGRATSPSTISGQLHCALLYMPPGSVYDTIMLLFFHSCAWSLQHFFIFCSLTRVLISVATWCIKNFVLTNLFSYYEKNSLFVYVALSRVSSQSSCHNHGWISCRYWTDNGACYYYDTGNYSNYEEVLDAVYADAQTANIPFRYLQVINQVWRCVFIHDY